MRGSLLSSTSDALVPNNCLSRLAGCLSKGGDGLIVGERVEEGLLKGGRAHTKHLMEHISHRLRPAHASHINCRSLPSKPWYQQERRSSLRSDVRVLQHAKPGTLTSALWLCGEVSLHPFFFISITELTSHLASSAPPKALTKYCISEKDLLRRLFDENVSKIQFANI